MKKRVPPALFLLFLAPFLGELVSGHMRPTEFFNPIIFILMALPYGFGALICRELRVRWKKGWLSLLLLAAAFAVYEEGIVVRSFFNPDWGELGNLRDYNLFAGINWTYSLVLIHFHILISVFSSVKLAEVVYAEKRAEPWLTDRQLALVVIGLLLWLPLGWQFTGYIPPVTHHVAVYLLCAALIYLARFMPGSEELMGESGRLHPLFFFIIGFVNVVVTFATVFILPEQEIYLPLAAVMAFLILFNLFTLSLLARLTRGFSRWSDRQRVALIAGLNLFFIITGFDEGKEIGAPIISLLSLLLLALLYFKVGRRKVEARA